MARSAAMRLSAALCLVAMTMFSSSIALADVPAAPDACADKKLGDPCANQSIASGTCQATDASASLVCATPPAVQGEKSSNGCSMAPGAANTWFVGGVGAFCIAALLRRRPASRSRRRPLSFA